MSPRLSTLFHFGCLSRRSRLSLSNFLFRSSVLQTPVPASAVLQSTFPAETLSSSSSSRSTPRVAAGFPRTPVPTLPLYQEMPRAGETEGDRRIAKFLTPLLRLSTVGEKKEEREKTERSQRRKRGREKEKGADERCATRINRGILNEAGKRRTDRLRGMKVRKTKSEREQRKRRKKRRKIMRKKRGGEKEKETGRGKWRPPTAAAEIFYELNCAGGLCPRESMCEDQTPRRRVLVRSGWWWWRRLPRINAAISPALLPSYISWGRSIAD